MNIGILGYGVVGSGVKEITKENVIKVFDIEAKKDIIGENLYTNNPYEIINDERIETIVECLGGLDTPYKLIKDALKNKKNVVTSNKEVVAKHLKELMELSKENDCLFLFEASVGGGIPVINSLELNKKVNEIEYIYGIINGSTNFILSRLEEGMKMEEALAIAREKGFLEKDPTQDLEGLDMLRKIAILSDIAYDTFIDIDSIYHYGIKNVTKEMIDFLKENGYYLRFVASSVLKENNTLDISVEPRALDSNNILSRVKNEFNSILIKGKTNDVLEFYGKGAGKYPTASAILSDIERIKNNTKNKDLSFDKKMNVISSQAIKYFVVDKDNNFMFTDSIKDENEIIFKARLD